MANRGAYAVAKELGTEPVVFPSHHGGFMGGEYGWPASQMRSRQSCGRSSARVQSRERVVEMSTSLPAESASVHHAGA